MHELMNLIEAHKIDVSEWGRCPQCDVKVILNVLEAIRQEGGLSPIGQLIQQAERDQGREVSECEVREAIQNAIAEALRIANDDKRFEQVSKDVEHEVEMFIKHEVEPAAKYVSDKIHKLLPGLSEEGP